MKIFKKVEEDFDPSQAEREEPSVSLEEERVARFFDDPEPASAHAAGSAAASPSVSIWEEEPKKDFDLERLTEVREIYAHFGLASSGPNTVYLLEEYIKTLPDSLPAESRRSIIIKMIGASGFDFDKLLGDGVDRVTKLSDHATAFAGRTDEIIARYNSEIEVLERQIQNIRGVIDDRKNLHKKQFLAIESEAKRLREVLDFITK